jgi:hypothetical protein
LQSFPGRGDDVPDDDDMMKIAMMILITVMDFSRPWLTTA